MRPVSIALATLVPALAGCDDGRGGARTSTYSRDDPAFALDVPAGFTARPVRDTPHGGQVLSFDGPSAAAYLRVEWAPVREDESPETARDSIRSIGRISGETATERAAGELGAGGVWLETDRTGGQVLAWLRIGEALIECAASGGGGGAPAGLLAACKTLRPR
jgi:hypothetical protein